MLQNILHHMGLYRIPSIQGLNRMKPGYHEWLRSIDHHANKCRAVRPIPARNGLSRSQVLQFHIIKGSLLHRLEQSPATFFPSRDERDNHAYCIVFTSSIPGLVAAREISQETHLPIVSLFPEEMRSFLQLCPDPEHKHHVHIWSHFLEKLDSQTARFAKRYPLRDNESYWLHVEGILCSPQRKRGTEHLWSWDGVRPKLLKKNLFHWAT